MEKSDDIEYIKSCFRCPICGKLVGCSADGKTGILSIKSFNLHVRLCRKVSRVKPGRIRYTDED
jgi:aminopeptidase C